MMTIAAPSFKASSEALKLKKDNKILPRSYYPIVLVYILSIPRDKLKPTIRAQPVVYIILTYFCNLNLIEFLVFNDKIKVVVCGSYDTYLFNTFQRLKLKEKEMI